MNRFISSTPKSEFVTMTPEIVDYLLEKNTGNRKVRRNRHEYFKNLAITGDFIVTNQGVGIDVTGTLVDGQHRLIALRDAEYPPVVMLVVYGLPIESRAAIDQGMNRTMSDLLHFAFDRPEATGNMVAIVRKWFLFVRGRTHAKTSPSEFLEAYEEMFDDLMLLHEVERFSKLPSSVAAAILEGLHNKKDNRILTFVEQVTTGEYLSKDSPAYRLRETLDSLRSRSGYVIEKERFDKTTSALVASLEGRTLSKLMARTNSRQLLRSGNPPTQNKSVRA